MEPIFILGVVRTPADGPSASDLIRKQPSSAVRLCSCIRAKVVILKTLNGDLYSTVPSDPTCIRVRH